MKPIIVFLLTLLQGSNAQKAILNEIQEAQTQDSKLTNPFLSTTLSTKITSVSDDLDFDSTRKSIFSETLAHFLTKIFKDQQVYDVKIISVNLFDDHILKDGHYEDVPTNGDAQHTLSFSTVVSAEYTQDDQASNIANDNFRKMLIHVCDKFQDHLIQFMNDTGDPYFMDVESVILGDFERIHGPTTAGQEDGTNNSVMGFSDETVNTVSIVAIVVGGIVFFALSFASVKYYRKEKQLNSNRWISKETATASFQGALIIRHPAVDDYSFDPLGTGNGYNGSVPPYTDYRDDPIHNTPSINEEETVFSSVWPESAPPTLFPAAAPAAPKKLSYTEELKKLPQQHVFAPPGKIGVAIDVVNGQPVVHKVRKNSPLEKMLQPNDIIVSIDDEDASCLSAADVTSMMVKRMDRVRKITFVRRG